MAEYQPVIFVRLVFSSRPIFLAKQHTTQIKAELPGFPPPPPGSPGAPGAAAAEPLACREHIGQGAGVSGSKASSPLAVLGEPLASRFPQS